MSSPDVVVVGGGLIGLASAWRLAQDGAQVVVVDPAPLSEASHAAAGMLAPVTEVVYGEEPLLALNLASARRYPGFVAELEEAAGARVGYRAEGTLSVAADAGDRAVLAELHAFHQRLGLESELLDRRACRELEPMLAPSVRGGLLVAGDHQVDNRRLGQALLAASARAGVRLVRSAARRWDNDGGLTLDDGSRLDAGLTVVALGAWSGRLAGLPAAATAPVRPVKGHILRLRMDPTAPLMSRTVRALVAGSHVYLVPRADGEVVVGATMEEMGYDRSVRAGAVYELLRDAHAVLPGVAELTLTESLAGLRPGSPDNAPIIGPTDDPRLLLATGHFRNGVLLTPVTADAVAAYVRTGTMPPEVASFSPGRFAAARR